MLPISPRRLILPLSFSFPSLLLPILPSFPLLFTPSSHQRFYKKTAAFVLKAVAKHSPALAKTVVETAGSLDALVGCLSEFEPAVKESAAWALGYIARHNTELAQHVVDAGAVPPLVLCVQEPELSLKRIAASTLAEICKHSPDLAQVVVDQGAVPCLSALVQHPDAKLKRQVCSCLAQIAKHSVDLAEMTVEAEIFPKIFMCLRDQDPVVRRNAATCIREIAKHTPELAQLIVNAGGHAAVIDYVASSQGAARLPGIMTLGYIGAFSETLALAIIVAQGLLPLKEALISERDDHIRAAAVWSLGQLGRHTPDHAKALAVADIFRRLLDCYTDSNADPDLKVKAQRALKSVLEKCTHLPALEPLLHEAPAKIVKYVVHQFAKVLPTSPAAHRSFVVSRGLNKILELRLVDKDPKLQEYIATICSLYPPDIVAFCSPNYVETVLNRLEEVDAAKAH